MEEKRTSLSLGWGVEEGGGGQMVGEVGREKSLVIYFLVGKNNK